MAACKYIDVVLPIPLAQSFTYSVPAEWSDALRIGMRVVVPFGSKKMYTGIVCLCHTNKPNLTEIKEVICLLDKRPVLRHPQLKFWEWIASYYLSSVGEVYRAALPSGLKLESETTVRINEVVDTEDSLSPKELKLIDLLFDGHSKTISELNKALHQRDVMPTLKILLEKNVIEIEEKLCEKYRAKTESFLRLTKKASDEKGLEEIFKDLKRAPKQEKLLMEFIELSKYFIPGKQREVSRREIQQRIPGTSAGALKSLIDKGILESFSKEVGRLEATEISTQEAFPLNEHQQAAYRKIRQHFASKQVVLLHGVTSSGKTEVYIHLAQQVLSEGKQVLYLVPEIALTTQLTTRLQRVFGRRLAVYHSKFPDAERVEIWNKMLQDEGYDIIIGVRSSIFLPFRKLGLVIVDEEHESSYKQLDPAPRYHARNAAIVLASMHGAKTLLGSATPAIESYYNAQMGKYALVELKQRHREQELPDIYTLDVKEAYRKKRMETHFSDVLLEKTEQALKHNEQVLLFQNRRGYAPYLECKCCAYVPRCTNCDVSLTVHKGINTLSCHYCGASETIPDSCPNCKTPGSLLTRGFGTEKIEEEIKLLFPEARVARMDLDTTRSRKSYTNIIGAFESHKIDILIGTQMISKGLDFDKVNLVGILNADNILNFPDFRSAERAFQMLTQVSGRAGRKDKKGEVVLQTSQPEHLVIQQVLRNDYAAMYEQQCKERACFHYPPFCRLIRITLRHRDAHTLERAASQFAVAMRKVFGTRVLGPNSPIIGRIQKLYLKDLLLKIEPQASQERAKDLVQQLIKQFGSFQEFRAIKFIVDVDPV